MKYSDEEQAVRLLRDVARLGRVVDNVPITAEDARIGSGGFVFARVAFIPADTLELVRSFLDDIGATT